MAWQQSLVCLLPSVDPVPSTQGLTRSGHVNLYWTTCSELQILHFDGKIYIRVWLFFFWPHHTAPWPWIEPKPSPVKAPVLTTGPSQEIPTMCVNIILAIRRVIKHDAKHAGRSEIMKDQVKYTKKQSVEFWKGGWDDNISSFKQPSGDNMEHRTAGKEKVRDGKAPLQVSSSEDREKGWIQGLLRS